MSTVLFLSQALPFPPDTGATRRTYHVLSELQREFDVVLVAFSRKGHQPDESSRAVAERELSTRLARVLPSVRYPGEWSRARRVWEHGRSLITGRAYIYFQYGVGEFGARLDEALEAGRPDLVHMDTPDLFPWLHRFDGIPVTCTHHDIESLVLQRRAEGASNPLLAAYIRRQATLMRRIESTYCPRVALNLTMSENDSARLRAIAPSAAIHEVPNAVDLGDFRLPDPGLEEEDSVVFVGATYLFANKDAVGFLLDEIWPRVLSRRPSATLTLVGQNEPGEVAIFSRAPGVHPVGRVERVQSYLERAACSVIPLRIGGGTRLKILESWALGRAVVTTGIGCEGLEIREGENALVRDDPEPFARAVVQVLEDRALRARLGRSGRRTVERRYGWSAVGADLRERYSELMHVGSVIREPGGRGR